ncbi:MAG: pantoate--beta-alanine ligase [Cytophagia bacterium]|nr:pantoate--beta-alanine ligase [Cytophagia bacterium]
MKVFNTIQDLRAYLSDFRNNSKIGLVPTMGALHQGHISLVNESKKQADITVATIFVNPTQFNNPEDLEKYPRTLKGDLEKLQAANCDVVFAPETKEVYPNKPEVSINLGAITKELEGKFRPGHFDGVGLVVSKLFHIVQPDLAFFGQKDLQQFFVIKKLVDELNFPLQLQMVPTERELNGLAMSSRNMRLSETEKEEAGLLYESLKEAQKSLLSSPSTLTVKATIEELFKKSERLSLEYFEVVNTSDFKPLQVVTEKEKTALCIAAEIGGVRLIDNLLLIS